VRRLTVASDGWLARTQASFPEQRIGKRFLIRPTHLPDPPCFGRLRLRLDAGLAFGTGEHGSTRGCLLALEAVAHRRPRRLLDLGTGSGVLAIAAIRMLGTPVLATDIDPWSVRVAKANARLNELHRTVRVRLADGWGHRMLRGRQYDLVLANILARPLCAMARDLSQHLAPGGTAILAGLLDEQIPMVLAAHRRCGLHLGRRILVDRWATLVLRKPPADPADRWPDQVR
jgi:ribosomal protein L11 methyltransferase